MRGLLLGLLFLSLAPAAGAQTLQLQSHAFEGKVIRRPDGLLAQLKPLAEALKVSVFPCGDGLWVGRQKPEKMPDVPSGQVMVGSQLLATEADDAGELYVPAEAFCRALGGTARRSDDVVNLIPPSNHSAGAVRRDDPASFFFTQMRSSTNPTASAANGNCGPACLAMAALAFDRFPLGVNPDDRQAMIRWCQVALTGRADDTLGSNPKQMMSAARQLNLNPDYIMQFEELDKSLLGGRMAIVSGYPEALGFNTGGHLSHAMLIVGKSGDDYLVNDPGLWYYVPGTRVRRDQLKAYFTHAISVGDKPPQ